MGESKCRLVGACECVLSCLWACVCAEQQRVTLLSSTGLPGTETHLHCSFSSEVARGSGSPKLTPRMAHFFPPVIRALLWAEPGGRPGCLVVPPGETDSNQSLAPSALPHGSADFH